MLGKSKLTYSAQALKDRMIDNIPFPVVEFDKPVNGNTNGIAAIHGANNTLTRPGVNKSTYVVMPQKRSSDSGAPLEH